MRIRPRGSGRVEEDDRFAEADLEFDALSDEELEEFLFEEEAPPKKGPLNVPTVAGLSMILVGILYLLQQLGLLGGFSLGALVAWLPWLAGILIILLGFGVLSWQPSRKGTKRSTAKRRRKKPDAKGLKREVEKRKATKKAGAATKKKARSSRHRLRKSAKRKVSGVCGGLAEYFGVDPTIVRLAFVIGTIFAPVTAGIVPIGYVILAFAMSAPAKVQPATLPPSSRSSPSDVENPFADDTN